MTINSQFIVNQIAALSKDKKSMHIFGAADHQFKMNSPLSKLKISNIEKQ